MKTYFIKLIFTLNILLFILNQNSYSEKVTLKGFAPTYAGDLVTFYYFQDYFAYTKKILCNAEINDSGYFKCSFDITETLKIYTDIGIFNAHLYIEPGKEYELVLPEKVEKEMKDKLNPYFQPVDIHLGIKGAKDNELNVMIRMFDDSYIPYYNKHVINVVSNMDLTKLDEDIEKLKEPFKGKDNQFFNLYIKYRIGLLRFLAQQNKSKKLSNEYFKEEKIYYNNPAYIELFNQVFDKYFMYFGNIKEGEKISEDIGKFKSFNRVKKTLSKDKILSSNNILELVILKNIYDEFYMPNFSRASLLTILDSLIIQTNIEIHKIIGANLKNKMTRLMNGYTPPDFELYNEDSVLVKLSNLKGKYIYLNFCASHSYSCLQEYEALKYLYEKHHERLEIITISVDISFEAMLKYKKQLNCPWTFLYYGNQPEILDEYDIRAFPTYYLIDRDGKLVISPAPSPNENFEKALFKTMRNRGEI